MLTTVPKTPTMEAGQKLPVFFNARKYIARGRWPEYNGYIVIFKEAW